MRDFFLIISLMVFSKTSNGQSSKFDIIYLAKYKFTHQRDSMDLNSLTINYMNLEIGKNETRYYSSQRQIGYNKSLYDLKVETPLNIVMENASSYYHDAETEIIMYKIGGKDYNIYDQLTFNSKYRSIDTFGLPVWNLTNDTSTILNQVCQKATTSFRGRHYEAWFATKIPLPVGPYKFVGLPGLLLKITDHRNQFVIECTELVSNVFKVPIFTLYSNCQNISYKKLNELRKLKIENRKFFMQMEYPNVTVTSYGTSTNQIKKKDILAPYNPIELTQ